MKEVDSSSGMASSVVFMGMRVKRGTVGGGEFSKNDFLVDVKNQCTTDRIPSISCHKKK